MTTKRMLINATQKEELRVALVSGQRLYDLDIERKDKSQKKASIYKGRVTRVEPSLEAAFIEYGSNRHGFLPLKEVSKEYFHTKSFERGRPSIKEALKPGQEIIVQIDKEERGNKGAALTTFISLAGCYLVLMPNNPRAGGISRRIEGEERDELKEALNNLPVPNDMGLIVRTAGLGRSIEELQWDLEVLLSQWEAIKSIADSNSAPLLIHQDNDVIIRAIRDYLRPEISEIIVDTQKAFEQVENHLNLVRPDFTSRLKLHQGDTPLFTSFQIESQIESAHQREVSLENGASIVIDATEALIAIDINSAKATEGGDIEETAFKTNLAAASEIARQLRLRDMGGLIVIDFIDMNQTRHQRMVENKLREEFQPDRARIQTGRLSRFGLLEMSRQRLRPALGDINHIPCPRCSGQGNIRTTPSVALALIRVIEEEVRKERTARVHVQVPVEVASYLLNEKRGTLSKLEDNYTVSIVIIPNKYLETPQYELQWFKQEDLQHATNRHSYQQVTPKKVAAPESAAMPDKRSDEREPALKHFTPKTAAPSIHRDEGIIKKIWTAVLGAVSKSDESEDSKDLEQGRKNKRQGQNQRRGKSGNYRGNGGRHGHDNRKRHGHNRRHNNQNQTQNRNHEHSEKTTSQEHDTLNREAQKNDRGQNRNQNRNRNRNRNRNQNRNQNQNTNEHNQQNEPQSPRSAEQINASHQKQQQGKQQNKQQDNHQQNIKPTAQTDAQPPMQPSQVVTTEQAPAPIRVEPQAQPVEMKPESKPVEQPVKQKAKVVVENKVEEKPQKEPKVIDPRFNQTSFSQLNDSQRQKSVVTLVKPATTPVTGVSPLSQVVTSKETTQAQPPKALPKIQSTLQAKPKVEPANKPVEPSVKENSESS